MASAVRGCCWGGGGSGESDWIGAFSVTPLLSQPTPQDQKRLQTTGDAFRLLAGSRLAKPTSLRKRLVLRAHVPIARGQCLCVTRVSFFFVLLLARYPIIEPKSQTGSTPRAAFDQYSFIIFPMPGCVLDYSSSLAH